MRCQKCGRMLLNPGIPVPMHGFVLIVGPTCAEKMGAAKPKVKRAHPVFRRTRVARRDQLDLFGVAA